MTDSYDWDASKAETNFRKHRIRFEEAVQIFDGIVLSQGQRHDASGEYRELSFGLLGDVVVLAVAHMDRDGRTRIISARRATKQERRRFYDHIEKTLG